MNFEEIMSLARQKSKPVFILGSDTSDLRAGPNLNKFLGYLAKTNPSHLKLANKKIAHIEICWLAQAIQRKLENRFNHLRHIDLSRNNISDDSAKVLSGQILIPSRLEIIDLSFNQITGKGAKTLVEGAIELNQRLLLIFENNPISEQAYQKLNELIDGTYVQIKWSLPSNQNVVDELKAPPIIQQKKKLISSDKVKELLQLFSNVPHLQQKVTMSEWSFFKLETKMNNLSKRRNSLNDLDKNATVPEDLQRKVIEENQDYISRSTGSFSPTFKDNWLAEPQKPVDQEEDWIVLTP